MKNYCIWIVCPPGYAHSQTFDELALGLSCAFRELGYNAPIVRDITELTAYPIVLGCNLVPSLGNVPIPKNSIMFNAEQIQPGSPWMVESYINLLRSHQVWDYSRHNIASLTKLGVTNVRFCGIGYVPELTKIKPAPEKDIDILLYGSLNERRLNILKQLHQIGLKLEALFGVYGVERDHYISRAKIVLNIHFYETKVFEIVRVSYLLANKKFVISEPGNDQELESPFRDGLVFAPYNGLVEECVKYLREDNLRTEIAEKGFASMKSLCQVQFLKKVLEQ